MDAPASKPTASHKGSGASGKTIFALVRWAAFAACLALFAFALAKSDLRAAWQHIEGIGPLAIVALAPFPLGLLMDAWAWRVLLAALDRKVSLGTLWKVRFATEAVTNSAPIGAIWADALSPILVSRRADVPAVDVFAASTAKRWLVVRAHALYVTTATILGYGILSRASESLVKSHLLVPICFGSVVFLLLVSFAIEAVAARGGVAKRISTFLGNKRFGRVQAWVETRRHHFEQADTQLAKLSKSPRAAFAAAWRLLGQWVIEGLETYLLLRLLGAQMTFLEVFAMDAALSVVRSVAVFAPAGIGVQDVGYLAMFEAFGVPNASALGPAFVVLKRVKEAIWVAIGFAILARMGSKDEIAAAKARVESE